MKINAIPHTTLDGGTSLVMALGNKRTNRSACLKQYIILDSMSLGLILVERCCSHGDIHRCGHVHRHRRVES